MYDMYIHDLGMGMYVCIVGASLSEPHTYEENGGFVCLYIRIYIYISVVRRAVYFYLPDSCGHLNRDIPLIVYAV